MAALITWLTAHLRVARRDGGFVTAESLAVAGLGVVALIAIFAVLQTLGVDIVNWIRDNTINA